MATLFVDDGGSNTSPFDTWAKAADGSNSGGIKAALADAACVAGSTIYVGHNSTTTYTASVTYTNSGTAANPIKIYSVTSGDETTLNAGAIEDADGATTYDLLYSGHVYVYGVVFKCGRDVRMVDNTSWIFEECEIQANRSSRYLGSLGAEGAYWKLINTDITCNASDQYIRLTEGCKLEWLGGTLNTNLNYLFKVADEGGIYIVRGVDLSAMTGAGTKFIIDGFGSSGDEAVSLEVSGCKLAAANPPVLVNDTPAIDGVHISMESCHSGDQPYFQHHMSQGDVYLDTSVYRSAQYDGSTEYSAKIVTNANASYVKPLRFKLAEVWCSANPTLTVHCTHDINGDSSDAQDDEVWLEIEYPTSGNTAYRQWDRTSKMAPLGTAADLTTEGSAGWTSSQNVDNSIAVTIAGGGAGVHTIWVCSARASETIYFCPKVDVT